MVVVRHKYVNKDAVEDMHQETKAVKSHTVSLPLVLNDFLNATGVKYWNFFAFRKKRDEGDVLAFYCLNHLVIHHLIFNVFANNGK